MPCGVPVAQSVTIKTSEIRSVLASMFDIWPNGVFETGKNYLRVKYMRKVHRVVESSQPSVGHVTDEKQIEATKLLRLWAVALTNDERSTIFKKAQAFITGRPTIEDATANLKKAHPKSRLPVTRTMQA